MFMKAQARRVVALANRGDARVAGLVTDCVSVPVASEYLLPPFFEWFRCSCSRPTWRWSTAWIWFPRPEEGYLARGNPRQRELKQVLKLCRRSGLSPQRLKCLREPVAFHFRCRRKPVCSFRVAPTGDFLRFNFLRFSQDCVRAAGSDSILHPKNENLSPECSLGYYPSLPPGGSCHSSGFKFWSSHAVTKAHRT